jgi:hypothetical protein
MTVGEQTKPAATGRLARVVGVALVVLAVEYNIADPSMIAADERLAPLPFALLALLVPLALGVWTLTVSSGSQIRYKADFLWGVLFGTLCYVGVSLIVRLM